MKEPLVYIIIVNCNGKELLRQCLKSLFSITRYSNYRVVVVDNGSVDGSVEMVQQEFPQVELICNPRNLGYAKANNQGIVYALMKGAKYIALLNNDIEIIEPLWLKVAVKVMESHLDVGLIGFNLVTP